MDLLRRELAPIPSAAWAQIDEDARQILELNLAGRRVVDVDGPHGWHLAAVNTGHLDLQDWQPVEGVHAGLRRSLPVLELRTPILLRQAALDDLDRGVKDPELDAVAEAAAKLARAEDAAIFHGLEQASIVGVLGASPHDPIAVSGPADYPRAVRQAMSTLARQGIGGPYALVLGPDAFDAVFAALEAGYPVAKQIERQVLDGPIVRAPALDGGLVMSCRGGDYELTLGQDVSIGFAGVRGDEVELFMTESFAFRVLEPAAAVRLVSG